MWTKACGLPPGCGATTSGRPSACRYGSPSSTWTANSPCRWSTRHDSPPLLRQPSTGPSPEGPARASADIRPDRSVIAFSAQAQLLGLLGCPTAIPDGEREEVTL